MLKVLSVICLISFSVYFLNFSNIGLNTDIVYMQGFSVTLPPDLQEKCVNSIKGLEGATMTKPGMYNDLSLLRHMAVV